MLLSKKNFVTKNNPICYTIGQLIRTFHLGGSHMAEILCWLDEEEKTLYPTSKLQRDNQLVAWENNTSNAREKGYRTRPDMPTAEAASYVCLVTVDIKSGSVEKLEPAQRRRTGGHALERTQRKQQEPDDRLAEVDPYVPLPGEERLETKRRIQRMEEAAQSGFQIPVVPVLIVVCVIVLAIAAVAFLGRSGGEPSPGYHQQDPNSVQVTAPPATQVPEPIHMTSQILNVGTADAVGNKVTMDCGGKSLTFTVSARKRVDTSRLELTLMTDVPVAVDALWPDTIGDHINKATLLAHGTTCGVQVEWDGINATYTPIGP